MPEWLQDPSDLLDYTFDFAAKTNGVPDAKGDWLAVGEVIVEHEVFATPGITIASSERIRNNTAVLVWVTGGVRRARGYRVTVGITTNTGRQAQRSITIHVNDM